MAPASRSRARRSAASVTGSAVVSSPSATTARPPTSSVCTGPRRAEGEREHRVGDAGEAGLVEVPERDVGERARAEVAELVLAAEAARAVAGRHLERVARRERRRARGRRARARARRAARRPARRTRSRPRRRRRARPRCPRPAAPGTGRDPGAEPAVGRGAVRDARARRAHLLRLGAVQVHAVGEPDVLAEPAERLDVLHAGARRSAPCRTPPRRRSRRGGCAGGRRARGRARPSRASARPVTENGEVGARAMRTIAPGAGSWKRSIASALAARIASRSSTTSSGGSPPALRPRSIAPRHGWKRRPIARAAPISTSSRSPARDGKM